LRHYGASILQGQQLSFEVMKATASHSMYVLWGIDRFALSISFLKGM
jgi:hypothetical protein